MGITFYDCLSSLPSVRLLTPVSRDTVSLLSGWISVKLGTNIYCVSEHC